MTFARSSSVIVAALGWGASAIVARGGWGWGWGWFVSIFDVSIEMSFIRVLRVWQRPWQMRRRRRKARAAAGEEVE